jgi:NAD(P)-dependent dehydrogenase (short-subunit alcohol dehydrogenase family)
MKPTRTWIVTGGNAGLGFQCCRFLAQQPGSLIVIASRDTRKGEAAAQQLRREGGAAEVLALDLNVLGAVRAFVEAFSLGPATASWHRVQCRRTNHHGSDSNGGRL